jgi:hypothetical protein
MRSLVGVDRMSVRPILALVCGLIVNNTPSRGQDGTERTQAVAEVKSTVAVAAKSDKAEKSDDSTQTAMLEAQAAFEKEQREMKQRLEKDPHWQPSHAQVAVIKPNEGSIESFCINKDGDLLICCTGTQQSLFGITFARPSAARGVIAVFSSEGKKIGDWQAPVLPQAICRGGDGMIYVAGAGRIAKLEPSGKVLAQADAPNMAELPPVPEVKKQPKKEGPEAEAAEKAKKEKIAELEKKLQQAQKDYVQVIQEAQKDLKPNDDESMQAVQEKAKGPLEKLLAIQQELEKARLTPEMLAAQARMMRERMTTITGMAVTDHDLFVCCASTKGFGYVVWRTDHNFSNPKKIVENLAGCCGQMDIQARGGDLWVAHNSRHKVEHYSREGKKLAAFGRTDRISADGFGGCCEPKNLRFGPSDIVFACESGPPTCVKRFTLDGKFVGVCVVAPWNSGCVRVTTEYDAKQDRFFVLNSGEQQIHVFAKKTATKELPATATLETGKNAN